MEAKLMPRSLERDHPVADWMTHERRHWIGAIVIAGLAGYGLGNGHTTSSAIDHVSMQLGDTKAQVHQLKAANNCEAKRGDKAAAVAQDAIKGALVATAPIPSPSDIPADNCPHPK